MATLSFLIAICLFWGAHPDIVGNQSVSQSSPCSKDEIPTDSYIYLYNVRSNVNKKIRDALQGPTTLIYRTNYDTFTETIEVVLNEIIPGTHLSLAALLDTLQDKPDSGNTCLFFLYGEAVRNMLLESIVTAVTILTSCDISPMLTSCKEEWANPNNADSACIFNEGTNTLQIGDPDLATQTGSTVLVSPMRDLTVPLYLKTTQFGQLDYTTNSLVLDINSIVQKDWAIIDITGNGLSDTCNKEIRLPVSGSDLSTWIGNKSPAVLLHYWALKVLDYTAHQDTKQVIINLLRGDCFSSNGCDSSVKELQGFYCTYAALGILYESHCSNPAPNCDLSITSQGKYYDLLEEDLESFWSETMWPLVKKTRFDCEFTPASAEIVSYRPESFTFLLVLLAFFM